MKRVHNFSAGPSVLPEAVLREAAEEMLDYRGSGMSVMEMSHRSEVFNEIMAQTESDLRELLQIPAGYHVLFLQGGASTQFASVPLNLMPREGQADYVNTGAWSKKAIAEARLYGDIAIVASSEDRNYNYIPEIDSDFLRANTAYAHITTNNTIHGTRFRSYPVLDKVPLVADMSSEFLSGPIDVSRFGLIYAGAQKNAGPAGVTIVIIRDDLIGRERPETPTMLRYSTAVKAGSRYNTPPCYSIYICGKVFRTLIDEGGLVAAAARNREKAELLYQYLDNSALFRPTVESRHRSHMNIPFLLPDDVLTRSFLEKAEKRGLVNLKGHRSVGGLRASLYNALPLDSVRVLVAFMEEFEKDHT